MKLESLKPGMTVYDVHSERMGNTMCRTVGIWRVVIKSVDLEHYRVVASWNGNGDEIFYSHAWSKWRLKKPVLVSTCLGNRLATRAELKAMKEAK